MFGGYIWGSLADIYGRRAVLLWSLTVNGLGGLASSLSQTFPVFLVLRFISGTGYMKPLTVIQSDKMILIINTNFCNMITVLSILELEAACLSYLHITPNSNQRIEEAP